MVDREEEILKSDDSCTGNPEISKSQIGRAGISGFGFEMLGSPDFQQK
jgi:hypothetical protein